MHILKFLIVPILCINSCLLAQERIGYFIKAGAKISHSTSYVLSNPNPSSQTLMDFYSLGVKVKFGESRLNNIIGYFNLLERTKHRYKYRPIFTSSQIDYKSNPVEIRSVALGYSKHLGSKNPTLYFEPKILIGHHWPVFKVTGIDEGELKYIDDDKITTYYILEDITQYYFNSYFIESGFNLGKKISNNISVEFQTNFRFSFFEPLFERVLAYNLEIDGNYNPNTFQIGAINSGNAIYTGLCILYTNR